LEDILQAGAAKARKTAGPFLQQLREAVGLRSFAVQGADLTSSKKKAKKVSRVVSFRDDEGFRFRVLNSKGEDLLLSKAFADGRASGMASKHVQTAQDDLDIRQADQQLSVWLEDECIAQSQQYATDEACAEALTELRSALANDEN
ncbi:MAG TPA: tryptophan--tRNA ligase, partial [Pseudomonas sp.]|nr:tryptophan--tRNA ligase [Pseudomonas sp.]